MVVTIAVVWAGPWLARMVVTIAVVCAGPWFAGGCKWW